jgi:hypothetical protein
MSGEASGYVWRRSPYTGTKFAIHLAIADTVNDTHRNQLWMSSDQIALKARAHRRTVQRTIDDMVADGFLNLIKEATQHFPATYEFVFKETPTVWESRGDISSLRGDISSIRGDISSLRGGDTPPELNITKQNQIEPNTSSSSVDDGFATFWATYPRRIGKGAALKAWKKALKVATADQILAGAETYAQIRAGDDPQYTAHPATWLNQQRWEDEPDPETRRPQTKWATQMQEIGNYLENRTHNPFDLPTQGELNP